MGLRNLFALEMLGIPVIILAGSTLHFAFEWSGNWTPLAVIAAVNESTWEHLKLAFWPALIWACLEYTLLRPEPARFFAAKGIAFLVAPVLIVSVFYGYKALLGRNIFALDIATFALAVIALQLVSMRLITARFQAEMAKALGITALVLQLTAYSSLTFYPPPQFLFEDPRDSSRGIPGTRMQ